MATEKLSLPTITSNMSADVPRDLNALANAIDGKTGVANGLATLGADGKVPSSQLNISSTADKITVLDANNRFASSNVEGALNELFTFANNGKTDIASVIGSPATSNDTFSQLKTHIQNSKNALAMNLTAKGQAAAGTEGLSGLAAKVANIELGRKFASGQATVNGITHDFQLAYGGTRNAYYIEVTGLTFEPSMIVMYKPDNTTYVTYYNKSLGAVPITLAVQRLSSSNGAYGIVLNQYAYVTNTGFKLPVTNSSGTISWYAYE